MLQPKDTEQLNRCKNRTQIYVAYKRLIKDLKKNTLEVKLWEKIFHAKDASFHENKKKYEISTLTSDKIDCKTKVVTRDKEEYYIIINE